ncbi:MAG: tRNA 2-thiouridine(34) synthase MnmA [Rhodospirillales bacterium]|nr:tRNA 2-thiouridine(34) synthase MnmA [Rhodospirillales bacterium]MDE2574119.1 tRNA 2-thiouridine(34) synthase MnmA [Rhodospirillales bacterium]
MRVVVAMSGGVDSSVVAGLLVEAGHEVIGVTLQLYDHGQATGRKGACCAGQDIHDARRVADRLGIAHYVIDAEARFRDAVMADFADSYAAGETPVPCVRCNQSVKFTDLIALAADLGAERLATGHYVRRLDGPEGAELHRAADPARDQSWFLFATTAPQLARTIFPLGDMADKAQVRDIAARLGLGVAAKPDSQDICFVPAGSYADIVGARRPEALAPGDIVSETGEVLGRHDGIARYTVGQARRLGTASNAGGVRRVVVGLDAARRRVMVGPPESGARHIRLREVNWLAPASVRRCTVKLRARETPHWAQVTPTESGADVLLDAAALAAPGQACVFYDGERVLGGGFIQPGAAAH